MNSVISSSQIEDRPKRLKEFIKSNKCRIGSWAFGVCSAWFGAAEYEWLNLKIYGVDCKIAAVVIPIVLAGILQTIHIYLEAQNTSTIQNLQSKLKVQFASNP